MPPMHCQTSQKFNFMNVKQKEQIEERIANMRKQGMSKNADRLERALADAIHAEDPNAVAQAVRTYNSLSGMERHQFFAENKKTLTAAAFRFANHSAVEVALRKG